MNKLKLFLVGFSLIELLMTIAILGVALSIAMPSMMSVIASNKLTTQANDMVGALNVARSESAKQYKYAVVAKTGDKWEDGWRVFIDNNNDQSLNGDDVVIKNYESISTNSIKGAPEFISYRPDGRSQAKAEFKFCSPEGAYIKVGIANSGRIRTEKSSSAC